MCARNWQVWLTCGRVWLTCGWGRICILVGGYGYPVPVDGGKAMCSLALTSDWWAWLTYEWERHNIILVGVANLWMDVANL